MMYLLFHNSMWKVVRIAKTSDCKTLLILKWPPLYYVCIGLSLLLYIALPQKVQEEKESPKATYLCSFHPLSIFSLSFDRAAAAAVMNQLDS